MFHAPATSSMGHGEAKKLRNLLGGTRIIRHPLGGPWDLVTTYSWDNNPTYNWVTPISPFRGIISRVTSPVISGY